LEIQFTLPKQILRQEESSARPDRWTVGYADEWHMPASDDFGGRCQRPFRCGLIPQCGEERAATLFRLPDEYGGPCPAFVVETGNGCFPGNLRFSRTFH